MYSRLGKRNGCREATGYGSGDPVVQECDDGYKRDSYLVDVQTVSSISKSAVPPGTQGALGR